MGRREDRRLHEHVHIHLHFRNGEETCSVRQLSTRSASTPWAVLLAFGCGRRFKGEVAARAARCPDYVSRGPLQRVQAVVGTLRSDRAYLTDGGADAAQRKVSFSP